MEGGHYMDLQKLQGCRCLGGPVAGVLVAGGSVMAFSTVMAVRWIDSHRVVTVLGH